jgi:hypothetical protein
LKFFYLAALLFLLSDLAYAGQAERTATLRKRAVLTAGAYSISAMSLDAWERVALKVDVVPDDWLAATGYTAVLALERSIDNGATWKHWRTLTFAGGSLGAKGDGLPRFWTDPQSAMTEGVLVRGTLTTNQVLTVGFQARDVRD